MDGIIIVVGGTDALGGKDLVQPAAEARHILTGEDVFAELARQRGAFPAVEEGKQLAQVGEVIATGPERDGESGGVETAAGLGHEKRHPEVELQQVVHEAAAEVAHLVMRHVGAMEERGVHGVAALVGIVEHRGVPGAAHHVGREAVARGEIAAPVGEEAVIPAGAARVERGLGLDQEKSGAGAATEKAAAA